MEKKCSVDGCNNKHYGLGYCRKHYKEFKKYGEIRPPKPTTCSVDGCNGKIKAKGLCNKHWVQMNRHGEIYRTVNDSNEINYEDNYVKITLYNRDCDIVGYTLVDIDDYEKIKKFKICMNGSGYAVLTLEDNSHCLLHRYIMELDDDDLVIDHINRQRLDNRRINLRICSRKENSYNTSLRKDNTSGYKDISWSEKDNCWICRIVKDGEIYLKYSKDIPFLVEWRNEKLKELFGEFACTDDEN